MNYKLWLFKLLFFLFFLQFSQAQPNYFGGHSAKVKWEKLNATNVNVFFPKGWGRSAEEVYQYILNFDSLSNPTTLGKMKLKPQFVLQPFTTQSNGYVSYGPFKSELYLTPNPDIYSQSSVQWLQQLTYHEYRHIQQFNAFRQYTIPKIAYVLTGEYGLDFITNLVIPSYFWEGDAVYHETRFTNAGRGRLHHFMNPFRVIFENKYDYTWMQWRNGSMIKNIPNHYALGYLITSYGYEIYGDDFWKNITSDALKYKGVFYSFQKAFKSKYNISYKQFINDALAYYGANYVVGDTNAIQESDRFRSNQYWPQWIDSNKVIYLENSYKNQFRFKIKDLANNKNNSLAYQWISNERQFHYSNNRIVYTNISPNPRWHWSGYQDIVLYDINENKQKQITVKGKYFQPSIDESGNRIIAISQEGEQNALHLLTKKSSSDWSIHKIDNQLGYSYHLPRIVGDKFFAIVHTRDAKMSIAQINESGEHQLIFEPIFGQIGNFVMKGDTIFFNMNDSQRDRLYAWTNNELFLLEDAAANETYYYFDYKNDQFTYSNYKIEGLTVENACSSSFKWVPTGFNEWSTPPPAYFSKNTSLIHPIPLGKEVETKKVSPFGSPFKVYSWMSNELREDISFQIEGANILNSLYAYAGYSYTPDTDLSKYSAGLGVGVLFTRLSLNLQSQQKGEYFVPQGDSTVVSHAFNQNEINIGAAVPLVFYKKRSVHQLTPQLSVGKIFRETPTLRNTREYEYLRGIVQYTQYIPPAQNNIQTRLGFTLIGRIDRTWGNIRANREAYIGVTYLPGLGANHALDLSLQYQNIDRNNQIAVSDYVTFPRGFRNVYVHQLTKSVNNYHLPLVYPDWGFGNIFFIQRVRAQLFYDFARFKHYSVVNNTLNIVNGDAVSGGAWLWLDSKLWNQYKLSIGFRYAHSINNPFGLAFENYSISIPINL